MKPVIDRPLNGGTQKIYRFKNDYGASVVSHPYSYGGDRGLWELAVIQFDGEANDSFKLCYSTEITSDVEGYLEWDDVKMLLNRIEQL